MGHTIEEKRGKFSLSNLFRQANFLPKKYFVFLDSVRF